MMILTNYLQKKVYMPDIQSILLQINPNANIAFHTFYIDNNNVEALVAGHQVAINALDFSSDVPFLFDRVCRKENIPVLHPYNIGWAGLVTVLKPDSPHISIISKTGDDFELKMVDYVIQYNKNRRTPQKWMEDVVQAYKNEKTENPVHPQLSVASWIAGGLCTQILFHLCTGKPVKTFPKFYFSSILNDNN